MLTTRHSHLTTCDTVHLSHVLPCAAPHCSLGKNLATDHRMEQPTNRSLTAALTSHFRILAWVGGRCVLMRSFVMQVSLGLYLCKVQTSWSFL